MDGVYAGNAGAISGIAMDGGLSRPSMASEALGLPARRVCRNAGAISGIARDGEAFSYCWFTAAANEALVRSAPNWALEASARKSALLARARNAALLTRAAKSALEASAR